jgi:hypothetical protein
MAPASRATADRVVCASYDDKDFRLSLNAARWHAGSIMVQSPQFGFIHRRKINR